MIPTALHPFGRRLYDALCEYVESDGTQYVDTGIVPTDTTGVEAVLMIRSDNGTDNVPFGARENSGNTRFLEDIDWGQNSIGWGFGTYSPSNARCSLPGKAGSIVTSSLNFLNDRCGRVDGVAYDTSLETKSLPSITRPIYIFALDLGGTVRYPYTGRIYRVTITSGTTLVRDLAPCRVGTAGALYDRVSGALYRSATSTDLVPGPDL